MANNERMIFGIGFDLATGVDAVIKEWEGKESKRLQKALDKKPLKISLEIKKNFITELRDFVRVTREVANAQRAINKAKKEELDIAAKAATVKTREANQRAANVRAAVQEATRQDQINKKKADAAYAEERLSQAKKNGIAATQAQNAAYKTQGGYLQRLIQRMAVYFSIHQAFTFLTKIRETTAEFEKQRIALGALIQDTYKANTIFEQIKVQAVKSPYEVKDLVDFTKKLAAYGVKADSLLGEMNKLADISAGLGTEMSRIILAYGQIQAAGVLKGTELRQLTELGLPMVDLLAQYYSELRNEVVSTSEVFDMISKKEIPFQAVKDILNDLTSEGGRFYQMQSKQAETLAGQWANMKDTLSIMYDEMGSSEQMREFFGYWIDKTKSVATNWRDIWATLKGVILTFGVLKGVSKVMSLLSVTTISATRAVTRLRRAKEEYASTTIRANGLAVVHAARMKFAAAATLKAARATNVAKKAILSLTAAAASNPIGAIMTIVGGIATLVLSLRKGRDEMDAFRDKQAEFVSESVENTDMLVTNFKRLANEVIRSEEGSNRQLSALRRLKQQYGDMIPEYKLTSEYLRETADTADDASKAFDGLAQSIRMFSIEKVRDNLITNYQTQLEQQFKDLFSKFGTQYSKTIGDIMRVAFQEGMGEQDIWRMILDQVAEPYGGIWGGAFQNRLGLSTKEFNEELLNVDKARKLFKDLDDSDLGNAIVSLFKFAMAMRNANGEIDNMMNAFDNLDPKLRDTNTLLKNLKAELEIIETNTGGETAEAVAEKIAKQREEAINKTLATLITNEGLDVSKSPFEITVENVLNNLDKFKAVAKAKGIEISDAFWSGLNSLRAMQGDYDDLWREDLANMVTYLDGGKRKVQAYSTDQIDRFENLSKALDAVAERYTKLDTDVKQLNKTQDALKSKPIDKQDVALIEQYRKEITKTETVMKFLYDFLAKYGALDLLDEKKKGKKVNPDIKKLEDEVALIEKIYKKYKEFREYMDEENARSEVEKYFEGVELKWLDKAFSSEELKIQLNEALRLLRTFWGDTEKAQKDVQFKIGDIDFQTTKENLEKSLKRLSDDISRTKTAKDFFDKMLGMTGDKQLSATLTMSVYGTTGDDLKAALVKQVEGAFKGVDISGAIDYNTMTINYQKLAEIYAKNQDKILDANKSMAESIVKDGQKTSASQIEQWAKELEAVKTYADKRVDIARQTQQRISEIEASTLPEDEKQRLQEQYRKKEEKDLAKLEYQAFKESPMYVAMFDNLDSASTTMLNNMRAKLMELKEAWGDLDMPTELKEMQSRLNEIDKQLASRNPFKTLANAYKGYQELREQGSRKDAEQDLIDKTEEHAKAVAQLGVFTRNATQAQKQYDDAVKKHGKDSAQAKSYEQLVKYSNALVDGQKETVNTTEDAVEASQELVNKWKELDDVVGGAWEQADMLTQAIINLGRGLADAFGGFGSEADAEYFDTMIDSFSNLSSGITSIGKGIAMGDPIAIINGIGSAISGLVGLFTAGQVRKANKDIERQQELLDNLAYSYERLEKAQEKAFGNDYISNYERQLENLEAQQEAYLKQAELERSKGKKADAEKIKEYEEQARDAADAIKDMYGSLSEKFLGSDLTSTARDFATAWIDAYKEFSNTTDAMKAKFQDMIQNMIVESLLAKVMEKALEPVFTMIDEMQGGDFYSSSFWQDVMTAMQTATDNGVVGAENVMSMLEQMGINLRGLGGEMTGISRDIATASEESILGLAAGINTQNFYISQVPTKLDTIIGLLRGDGAMPQGSAITLQDVMIAQNQFLSHLPTIAQHTAETVAECKQIVAETRRTADALDRVIKPDGTRTTYKMNVVTTYQG